MNKKPKKFNLDRLFLFGGGIMRLGETEKLDTAAIKKAKRGQTTLVNVVFVPAASNDLDAYIQDFTLRYSRLGGLVRTVRLVRNKHTPTFVVNLLKRADLIYLGGGDPDILMRAIDEYDLRGSLEAASVRGAVIVGMSAGSVIFGNRYVNFDRQDNKFVNFRSGKGLGWVDGQICAHFDKSFLNEAVIKSSRKKSVLWGISDRSALCWDGGVPFGLGGGVVVYSPNKSPKILTKISHE
jgi:peptidase E